MCFKGIELLLLVGKMQIAVYFHSGFNSRTATYPGLYQSLGSDCKVWRMYDGEWKNVDDKMRMIKCSC